MQCNKDLQYLKDNNFFDVDGFLEYLYTNHPETNNVYVTRMIFRILNEAASEYNYEDGEFVNRVASMIPGLTEKEVSRFANKLMVETP